MPLDVVWALSDGWYAGRLDPEFTPRSVAASQALLAEVGLVDDFWRLA